MKNIFIFLAIVLVAVLVAYEGLIFYDNNFRYGRMRETAAVRPHEEPMPIMEPGVVPVNGGDAILRVTEAGDLNPPIDLKAAASVARGRAVYLTFCAQCHGIDFDGNGTVGQSFNPLPTDLRSPAVQSLSAGMLFKGISYGIPGGRQPALDTTIMIEDRWKVVAFVKSLGPRNYRLQEKDFGLRYRSEFLVRRTGSTPPRIPPSGLAKIIFLKPIELVD